MDATASTAEGNPRSGVADMVEHSREKASLVERIRLGLAHADVDCRCPAAAYALLSRFRREEEIFRHAGALAEARRMRGLIVAVIALLGDLDKFIPDEPDASALSEMGDLFRDIREFVEHGMSAAQEASVTPAAIANAEQ